jgi:two-component system chemotaxis response regulator CheY
MKVLIVDDNGPTRTVAKDILAAAWNVDVRECSDGRAALQELGWKPDLVLVDYEMRPMDGAAFTRLLRAGGTGADPRTPVIMMTGHADREHVLKARQAGVDGLVVKPLSIRSMLERVQAVLARPRDTVVVQAAS